MVTHFDIIQLTFYYYIYLFLKFSLFLKIIDSLAVEYQEIAVIDEILYRIFKYNLRIKLHIFMRFYIFIKVI